MGHPSVFRIVPPAAALSFAELELQFAQRRRVEAAERSEIAERYSTLRRQYSEQSQRAQLHFADPRIKQPSCSALFHLAVESVKASRLAYAALREAESALRGSDPRIVPPDIVERAIDWNRQRLDRLEGQLRLLDLVDGVMLPLQKLFGQLEGSRHVSALGWRSIARHLWSQAERRENAASFLPLPGFSLKAYLSHAGQGHFGEAFGRGIETLVALAPVFAESDAESTGSDLLSIAALCQDCGLLLLARHRRFRRERDVDGIAGGEAHPSIGAGLVAGIGELAPELPSLVSEHHRRFISFDRPTELAPGIQQRRSRLLATTVRFLEIVDELAANEAGELPQPALYPAALRLNHEANRGEWDQDIAGKLLSTLGFQLKYEQAVGTDDETRRSRAADGMRRLDPADRTVPDPNFLFAHDARESRHVRATQR